MDYQPEIMHSPTPSSHLPTPKVALVADWLTNQGGAERVLLELHRMFPEAPIYTSVYNPNGSGMDAFKDANVRTSFIQHLPFAKTKHQLFPVLRRFAFERFDFSNYDIVISSSGAEAKGIKVSADGQNSLNTSYNLSEPEPNTNRYDRPVHICYCHSPTHYYWVRPDEYLNSSSMGLLGKILRLGLRLLIKPMRRWDYQASQRPDIMIANSSLTQERIKQFYDRNSAVIHPPVDVQRFKLPDNPPKRNGFVSLGRQVHYMRRDIAIEACNKLGLLLRVIGRGPEHEYLRSIAGKTIEFYEDLSDEEVVEALHHAEGLISCGIEDFGITAVEALSAGCPVIALKGSGAEDIVLKSKTGLFFNQQTAESLMEALAEFSDTNFQDSSKLAQSTKKFSNEVFRKKIEQLITENQEPEI